jgi:hypothetical protein
VTTTSEAEKSVDASLSVKLSVAVSVELSSESLVAIEMLGEFLSTVTASAEEAAETEEPD